jgi:hypothetical protein
MVCEEQSSKRKRHQWKQAVTERSGAATTTLRKQEWLVRSKVPKVKDITSLNFISIHSHWGLGFWVFWVLAKFVREKLGSVKNLSSAVASRGAGWVGLVQVGETRPGRVAVTCECRKLLDSLIKSPSRVFVSRKIGSRRHRFYTALNQF